MTQRVVARRSRRATGESDPRARGDSEGPIARLPAPGLSTASNDQGHPTSAGNRPDSHPGTGATRRAAPPLIRKSTVSRHAAVSGVSPDPIGVALVVGEAAQAAGSRVTL